MTQETFEWLKFKEAEANGLAAAYAARAAELDPMLSPISRSAVIRIYREAMAHYEKEAGSWLNKV